MPSYRLSVASGIACIAYLKFAQLFQAIAAFPQSHCAFTSVSVVPAFSGQRAVTNNCSQSSQQAPGQLIQSGLQRDSAWTACSPMSVRKLSGSMDYRSAGGCRTTPIPRDHQREQQENEQQWSSQVLLPHSRVRSLTTHLQATVWPWHHALSLTAKTTSCCRGRPCRRALRSRHPGTELVSNPSWTVKIWLV